VVAERGAERGVAIVEHVSGGRPHKVIGDYAENHDIDLIVMGSHGRAGVRRALLGSASPNGRYVRHTFQFSSSTTSTKTESPPNAHPTRARSRAEPFRNTDVFRR